MEKLKFSMYLETLRAKNRLSLRSFCSLAYFSVSHWTKVEKGEVPPPSDIDALFRAAKVFNLIGNDKLEFFERVFEQRKELMKDMYKSHIFS